MVLEWEKGEKTPTWKQLKKMANSYQVNIFMLTSDEDIKRNREIKDFRKAEWEKDLSLNTKKYLNFLLQRQRYISNVLKSENSKKINLLVAAKIFFLPKSWLNLLAKKSTINITQMIMAVI